MRKLKYREVETLFKVNIYLLIFTKSILDDGNLTMRKTDKAFMKLISQVRREIIARKQIISE